MDLVGVVVLALVTAIGGGTIRDVLLDRHPIFWLADSSYVVVSSLSALATVALAHRRRPRESLLLYADAAGLALFSLAGAQIAERTGLPALAGILLGTVTGAAGGIVRDVLCAEIPWVLRPGYLYASAAIAGTASYFVLTGLGMDRIPATLIGMAVVAGVRIYSIRRGVMLPEFRLEE